MSMRARGDEEPPSGATPKYERGETS